jgi:phosphoribosylanthranilate isomerase
MKIKICGNTDQANLKMVLKYAPDMVGFIFYPPSPRYVPPDAEVFKLDTGTVLRVGVFVDNSVSQILTVVKKCSLGGVQLHGIYPPDTAMTLKLACPFLKVIQVVHASERADVEGVARIADDVDWILFDTPGPLHGGHGRKFEWSLLGSYGGIKPFMIAGGVGLDNVGLLPHHHNLYGVDINSTVEDHPGMKNEMKVSRVIEAIRAC